MRRITAISLLLAALLAGLVGPGNAGATPPAKANHDLLVLRAGNGVGAALVALGGSSGLISNRLPVGLIESNGRTLYAATAQGDGQSLLRAVDIVSGRTLRSVSLAGAYVTGTGDYSASALSHNGRWLALRAQATAAGTMQAVVVDTAAMRVAATIRLHGHFGLDAIDADGKVLYLIENLARAGDHPYRVRSYDLLGGVLDSQPVLDKGQTDPNSATMSGVAWTRVWSPDGSWLYTLYIYRQPDGSAAAFVHALAVGARLAHCIDLPDNGAAGAALAQYTLSLSPDGSTLYAINPVLGRARAVHGVPFGNIQAVDLTVRASSARHTVNGSVLSGDGRRLFVATEKGIWVLDTATLAVRATYLPGRNVASLQLSDDGRRLYALQPQADLVQMLNPASGQLLGSMAARGSWAIAGITNSR